LKSFISERGKKGGGLYLCRFQTTTAGRGSRSVPARPQDTTGTTTGVHLAESVSEASARRLGPPTPAFHRRLLLVPNNIPFRTALFEVSCTYEKSRNDTYANRKQTTTLQKADLKSKSGKNEIFTLKKKRT
jgi:mRNA-degrading endonuclease toxin of MazEF toxin-antitoxin module